MSQPVISRHEPGRGSAGSYLIGFGVSLALTLAAYSLVAAQSLERTGLLAAIFILAVTQFIVQILLFLHLGAETKPRWKQLAFVFMVGTVIILVLGSIWVMASLDYRHELPPAEAEKQLLQDERPAHGH